jgi:hypothetical protein
MESVVVMEALVMEATTAPTMGSTAAASAMSPPGRDRGGEGERQHRNERHTEDLLHDRLPLTSVDLMAVYAE